MTADLRAALLEAFDRLAAVYGWHNLTTPGANVHKAQWSMWHETRQKIAALAAPPAPVAIDCDDCNGEGWTAYTTADPLPSGEPGEPYQVQQTCDACGGEGRLYVTPEPAPVALDVELLARHIADHYASGRHGYSDHACATAIAMEYAAASLSPDGDSRHTAPDSDAGDLHAGGLP